MPTVLTYLTKEEVKTLTQKSDLKALLEFANTWLWISGAFLLAGMYPSVVTAIAALIIIGSKQLACAILMHDCSHHSMFRSRKLNDVMGNWLGAYPILHDTFRYRPYHLKHHNHTGTSNDPDLGLTLGYPATKASLARKFFRDLSGMTGLKGNLGVLAMHGGILEYTLGGDVKKTGKSLNLWLFVRNIWGPLTSNILMFTVFWILGKPLLYLLWPAALLTTFQFCARVRSIAEHSVVPDVTDAMRNTRTTKASFIERLLFAPHHVNYHAEHHLLMSVPSYNLPRMHKLITERGYYTDGGVLEANYLKVLRLALKRL
jgi:fatty acid desaturase